MSLPGFINHLLSVKKHKHNYVNMRVKLHTTLLMQAIEYKFNSTWEYYHGDHHAAARDDVLFNDTCPRNTVIVRNEVKRQSPEVLQRSYLMVTQLHNHGDTSQILRMT